MSQYSARFAFVSPSAGRRAAGSALLLAGLAVLLASWVKQPEPVVASADDTVAETATAVPRASRPLAELLATTAMAVGPEPSGATGESGDGGGASSNRGLSIHSIQPAGVDVPAARQVVIQFDRPMVAVGRMERDASEVPVSIEPALACEWRWISTSALACQLGEAESLVAATRYRVTVRPEITARDGARLASEVRHEFTTIRPAISHVSFSNWLAPGHPVVRLALNQPVENASLESRLVFRTGGRSVPARVTMRGEGYDPEQDRYRLVEPAEELPLDVAVVLAVAPGVVSYLGPESGVEDRAVVSFYTFPASRFLGISCRDLERKQLEIDAGTPASPALACNPLESVYLRFSAPIIKEVLRDHLRFTPDLAGGREDYDPWDRVYSYSRLRGPRREGEIYSVEIPEVLRAEDRYEISAAAGDLLDEFGRPLVEDLSFAFRTSARPPRFVLTHSTSVLERQVDTHVPIVVTNLDELRVELRTVTGTESRREVERIDVADAKNVAFAMPLAARSWLGDQSGAVLGSVYSDPAVSTPERHFFTQVTPFAVHAKLGHRSSLVWVTDLASGSPVEGAKVDIFASSLESLPADPTALSEGVTDATGQVRLDGTDRLDPQLTKSGGLKVPYGFGDKTLLWVRVLWEGEIALLPLEYSFAVDARASGGSWVSMWQRPKGGHVRSWGTTAQGVYRVGDTVQYKLYVRDQDDLRFTASKAEGYTLIVRDPTGKEVLKLENQTLSAFGALDGEVPIAKTAAVGWYSFELDASHLPYTLYPLRVLVADFTPAPFRVTSVLDGERFLAGEEITVSTAAKLHSGGPYASARARISAQLRPSPLPVGPSAAGFYFHVGGGRPQTIHQSEGTVNANGELETKFLLPTSGLIHGRLAVESAVRDDRGKYVAANSSARFLGLDRFVGIRFKDWLLAAGKEAEAEALVVGLDGEPMAGVEVTTTIQYRETKASRVKGAGNAYLTRYVHSWVSAGSCTTTSADEPVACRFTPEKPGLYQVTHFILDGERRGHSTSMMRWSQGKGEVLWETSPGHQLSIIADKAEYKVGDTARFLIQNPFPGARALFTLERIGVQKSWTRVLENSAEVVEVEIGPDQLPGFYFSAVVTSPRVEAPLGHGEVDLGKPAFRMGYAQVPVRDPAKELTVAITPEREVYRPRDRVKVDLEVTPPAAVAGAGERPVELAVAVLDEAVFDLIAEGSAYFDPYRGFYNLDSLDVANFNLLRRLIGIQRFEKKGANPGGGGGDSADMRSVFKFVSYWNPSIEVGADRRASIEFDVPDNLTGWRVLALAVTPDDLMGLGEGTFKVNRPIELAPALPNQVVEGDRFIARFTVMNRTEQERRIRVTARVEGEADSPGLAGLDVVAPPYKRIPVSFPVRATDDGRMELIVRASSGEEADGLRLPITVRKMTALEAAATYGTTTDDRVDEVIAFPEGIRTDVGRVSVVATSSVVGNLTGAFDYLRRYPYLCWEQRLTKGVMAAFYGQLVPYLPSDFEWPEARELPGQTLADAADFQAPNGGMTYYIARDEYVSPYLSAYTGLAFAWLEEAGHPLPGPVVERLDAYLERLLKRDVFPTFYSDGMSSSVRAVAMAALSRRGKLSARDLERYRRHLPQMDLFGMAQFLDAASTVGDVAELEKEIADKVLARSNQTGGKVVFNEVVDTAFTRILHSPERSNCAVLSALVRRQGEAPEGTGIGDLPFRMVRHLTQSRGRRDRWENTQSNVFCAAALVDFSRVYERSAPRMTVRVELGGEELGRGKLDDRRDPPLDIGREIEEGDPGREADLTIHREGRGRLYYAARLFYSPSELRTEPINSGLTVRREYSVQREGQWHLLDGPIHIERGELVRVDLFLSLPTARNFVVVDDPIPGGLEPVNRQLATASTVDANQAGGKYAETSFWYRHSDWRSYGYTRWSFYHSELRHDAARFYSEYLPPGNYHLSYVAQAIAPGEFQVLPTHAEEMYDPDVFGQDVPRTLVVSDEEEGSE